MNIISKNENGILTIAVEGRVDSTTAPELEAEVKSTIGHCKELVFDFGELDYISSAGLRILLGARKIMGDGGMKVVNVNETVSDIFEVTGFSNIIDFEKK